MSVTFEPPTTVGRRVALRPIGSRDIEELYRIELSGDLATRWRFRGATPSPEQHARSLWDQVLATFVVVRKRDNNAVGLVCMYEPKLQHGTAHLALAAFPEHRESGLIFEGAALFIDYCFLNWNLRKIYAEAPEYNLVQYRSARRLFEEEARLKDAEYFGGRYWDKVTLTLDRERWLNLRGMILHHVVPGGVFGRGQAGGDQAVPAASAQ